MSPTTGILLLTLTMFPPDHKVKPEVHRHQIDAQLTAHPKHGHKAHKIHGHKAKKLAAPPTAIAAPMPSWDAVLGLPSQQLREPPIVALRGFRGGVLTEQQGQLTSLDDPSFWTAVPYGRLTVMVRLTVDEETLADMQIDEDFGFIQLFLDEKPLSNKRFLVNRDEMRLADEVDPMIQPVVLTYEFSIPCPAPGKHILQARYVFGGVWSRLSEPLRFDVRPPRQPQIVAAYNAGDVAGPLKRTGVVSITGGQVNLKLANVLANDQVISYLDGKKVHVETIVDGSCCVTVPIQGQVPPGKYALTVRIVPPGGQCELASEPSKEVMIHFFSEGDYLLRPASGCCASRHSMPYHAEIMPKTIEVEYDDVQNGAGEAIPVPTPASPKAVESPNGDAALRPTSIQHRTLTRPVRAATHLHGNSDVGQTPGAKEPRVGARRSRRGVRVQLASFQVPSPAQQAADEAADQATKAREAHQRAEQLVAEAIRAIDATDQATVHAKATRKIVDSIAKPLGSAESFAKSALQHSATASKWHEHTKAKSAGNEDIHRETAESASKCAKVAQDAVKESNFAADQKRRAQTAFENAQRYARAASKHADAVIAALPKVQIIEAEARRHSQEAENLATLAQFFADDNDELQAVNASVQAAQLRFQAEQVSSELEPHRDNLIQSVNLTIANQRAADVEREKAMAARTKLMQHLKAAERLANRAGFHADKAFASAKANALLFANAAVDETRLVAKSVENSSRELHRATETTSKASAAALTARRRNKIAQEQALAARKHRDESYRDKVHADFDAATDLAEQADEASDDADAAFEAAKTNASTVSIYAMQTNVAAHLATDKQTQAENELTVARNSYATAAQASSAATRLANEALALAQAGRFDSMLGVIDSARNRAREATAAAGGAIQAANEAHTFAEVAISAAEGTFTPSVHAHSAFASVAADAAKACRAASIAKHVTDLERLRNDKKDAVEKSRIEADKAKLRVERALAQDQTARSMAITGPPSPFYFASSAYFPQREFGPNGECVESDGLVIYEDMKFSFDAEGNYSLLFKVGTPAMPATLRLRLLVQPYRGGPWYTITVPPIRFQPEADKKHRLDYLAKVQDYEAKGRSEILRRCYGQMGQDARIRREGTATFGFGYRLMD